LSKYAKIPEQKDYETIIMVKFQLSLCKKCLGCNRLYDPEFEGVKECDNFAWGENESAPVTSA